MATEKTTFKEADFAQKIRYMNEYDNFAALYGIRLCELDYGFARMEMQVEDKHQNSQGRIHGGWLSGLLVIAGTKAALSYGQQVRLTQLSMNYCRNVPGGRVEIFAKEKQRNKHTAFYDVEMRTEEGKLLTCGSTAFQILPEEVAYHKMEPPKAKWQALLEPPVWPSDTADLHADIEGLRPCFSRVGWAERREYMNENEKLFYAEGIRVTEFGQGLCRAEMPILERHLAADGSLEPAWLAAILDPTMGKPSLSGGEFSVTAQMTINFFDTNATGKLIAEGRERTRGEHFGVCDGDVWDESGKLLASGACTMFLRHTEINFKREYPLNYPGGPPNA